MSKPRLLVVGAFPPPGTKIFGGVITSCQALLDSSFSDRFELVLVDSTQISNPPPAFLTRLLLAVRRLAVFVAQLKAARPQAVLLFSSSGSSLVEKGAMAWLARFTGAPALLFPRGGKLMDDVRRSRLHRTWIRWAFGGAARVLCQGPAWRRFVIEDLGLHPDKAPIVPNWTASPRLLAIGSKRAQRTPTDGVRLLFLGWVERTKGILELLDSCTNLAKTRQFSLTVAGKGHAEMIARKFVTQAGLTDRIHFAGWVHGADLEQLLAASDVLVLPSWAEGLPNAMIEAMAAGLAVVVSAVGNVPDVITNEREALLIPPKDVKALERALIRMMDDDEFRTALAIRGHEFARAQYSVEPAVKKLSEAVCTAIYKKNT